jgi:CDP-diacylglycerol--serine O-phosphatidyltransferase
MFKLKDYFTAASLLVSIGAVILGFQGRLPLASFLVFVAWGFDALDGLVARLTKTKNEFGAQFDDLVDHIAYTVAPGFIVYAALGPVSWWLGLAGCFATILLGTIRLALANTLSLRYPGYWIGVPRPASGFVIVSLLNARLFAGGHLAWVQVILIVLVAIGGLTRLPYKNHKTRMRPLEKAFPIAAVVSSLACYPFGWMFDVGLAWAVIYLCAPWIGLSAAQRAEIAAAVNETAAAKAAPAGVGVGH